MSEKIPCTFTSVWNGGIPIESSALYDPETGAVSDIQTAALPESLLEWLDNLEREFILVSGRELNVRRDDNGEYVVVHTYDVFFQREGYAQVEATSPEEAMRIANETLTYDDISWNETWPATYAQSED